MIRKQILNILLWVMPQVERISNVEDKTDRMRKMQVCKAFRKPKYKIEIGEDGYWHLVKIEEEMVEAYLADGYDRERDENFPRTDLSFRRDHDGE